MTNQPSNKNGRVKRGYPGQWDREEVSRAISYGFMLIKEDSLAMALEKNITLCIPLAADALGPGFLGVIRCQNRPYSDVNLSSLY